MKGKNKQESRIYESRFPSTLFFVYLGVLLVMSGIHTGLLVGANILGLGKVAQTIIPILYWSVVAIGLVLFTRRQIIRVYEEPMQKLAEATKKVAEGDFSIYIAPLHTSEKLDYLDKMLIDFNRMVEELGSIETLKTDFFSNVSHEMKTPLAVIQNHAELLCKQDLGEQQKMYVDTIFHTSKRLAELISNILKLNKLEKQMILPAVETYDLCEQLVQCAIGYEPAWEEKNLEFNAELEDRAEIMADPDLMELVWNNLLSNAVKFTEPGGKIRLTERTVGNEIYVCITDTGCGMTEETKKHIFEKFYQGDTSHATAGNGLGLALALRVLQLNNYKIEVTSRIGEGSSFTVLIPREEKEDIEEHERAYDRQL